MHRGLSIKYSKTSYRPEVERVVRRVFGAIFHAEFALAAIYFAEWAGEASGHRLFGVIESDEVFLLLCEVALGNVHEVSTKLVEHPPEGKDSIKGTSAWIAIRKCENITDFIY